MKNKNLVWGLAIIIILVAVIWYRHSRTPAPAVSTIRIDAVLSLSGEAASDGLNIKRGIELAKDDLAKKGIEVDIKYQDDKTDAKETVSALQYLVTTDHPQAIIGPTWSYLESAAATTIKADKIISYAPANTSEFVDVASPYQFHGAPRNALVEQPIADWLKANNKKKVAIIVSRDGWGTSLAVPFRKAAADAGASIVLDETIQSFSSDAAQTMSTLVTKAKAQGADVVLYTGYEQDAAALVKRRKELGLNATVIAATTVYQQLLSRGVVQAGQLQDAYSVTVPASPTFIKEFNAKYKEAPGNYADRAYDGMMILAEAIEHNPSTSADTLATYLRTKLNYKGFGGTYQFNENGDVIGGTWTITPMVND